MTIGRIPSVEGGIQPTIVDAKGDLIAATAADTVNRLAVGSNDQVLVADSSASTGLAWKSYGAQFVAGKNKIINGDFGVWQRGTSFTPANNTTAYTSDRWRVFCTYTSGTFTTSQQTFTPGTAPVSGYEGQYFLRVALPTASTYVELSQRIEDVRTFAGQTVTLSFWAKVASGTATIPVPVVIQNFGSGGSSDAYASLSGSVTATTSWQRFSWTFTMPSVSGKTIGASSFVAVYPFSIFAGGGITQASFDFWGMQLEAGSVATPFTTATGTIQGELAACQRYYFRFTGPDAYSTYGLGVFTGTTAGWLDIPHPVPLRTKASSLDVGNLAIQNAAASILAMNTITIDQGSLKQTTLNFNVASGGTQGQTGRIINNNNAAGFIGLSAEL